MKIIVEGSTHVYGSESTVELETDPELNKDWIVISIGGEKVDVRVSDLKRAIGAFE